MRPNLRRITFISEETGGYSRKFRVRDASGREWVAKIGKEAQSETAAVRLLWAIGYMTEINYLAPRVTIPGEGTFENVRFEACDLQATEFEETFDYVYSRFGTMFFDNPVPAFRNVRRAIAPGGRLCIVVWRRREDNPWLYVAENVVKPGSRSPRRRTSHAAGPAPSPRKMRTP